jgi:hypothetical protein
MKLFLARDEIFNQLFLHTERPALRDKVYISPGVCFEPPEDIKIKYSDMKPKDGVVELSFILEEDKK